MPRVPSTPRVFGSSLVLGLLLLVGCGSDKKETEPRLEPGQSLALESSHGLASMTVEAEGNLGQGTNALHVQFDNAAELVSASAFMPVHGHPAPDPSVVHDANAYRVTGLEFSMPGLWEITLDLRLASETDSVAFSVDVP